MSALFLVVAVAVQSSALFITDASRGCFGSSDDGATLKKSKDGYVDGSRVVPEAAVQHLREVLRASEQKQQFVPADLGITPASVLANRDQILRAAGLDPTKPLPPHVAERLDFDHVAANAKKYVDVGRRSTTSVQVSVQLDGAHGFMVSSTQDEALMLPWRVTVDGRSWATYSLEVPRAIAAVLTGMGNRDQLANTSYWPTQFWSEIYWRGWLTSAAQADEGRDRVRLLPGYDALLRRYAIEGAGVTDGKLFVGLKPLEPKLLDSISWTVDLKSEPDASFTALLRRIDRVERYLGGTTWLPRWKAELGASRVTLSFSDRVFPKALAAWQDGGLAGMPDAHVEISGRPYPNKVQRADVLLGPSERRVLVYTFCGLSGVDVVDEHGIWITTPRGAGYLIGDAQDHWARHALADVVPSARP